MQNQNLIDISGVPSEYHKLAFDFIDFLKSKGTNSNDHNQNYDKNKLLSTLDKVGRIDVFSDIENSVSWQREIRDDR
jgi:hypothetical protein